MDEVECVFKKSRGPRAVATWIWNPVRQLVFRNALLGREALGASWLFAGQLRCAAYALLHLVRLGSSGAPSKQRAVCLARELSDTTSHQGVSYLRSEYFRWTSPL